MKNNPTPKKIVADLYNRVAPFYGGVGPNFFKHSGRRTVELARIFPGARVLDVACGRGASLFPAADTNGEGGLTVGIDLAYEMLRVTKSEGEQQGEKKISLSQMDGDALGFPSNTFDFVLCGFAIFFFPQPDVTLKEWKRVLLPNGKLIVCVVGRSDERWNWFNESLVSYHERYGFPIAPMSGGKELNKPPEIQSAMLVADFRESTILTEDYQLIYSNEQEWWESKWTHGSRFALENMPSEILEQFHAEALSKLPALKGPDRFHENWQVAWVVGTK
ncbi:MAG TPA: methyltransferase domain-containing protein [Anaerolineales bacterium]|nr:methyltransferase domain-containing protein [Anaerolineales bacterium]